MKKRSIYFLFVIVFLITSCSNELDVREIPPDIKERKDIEVVELPRTGTKTTEAPELVLRFASEEIFNKAIEEFEDMSPIELAEWSENFAFKSVAEIYDEAMDEATELDFTESQYKAFKQKYEKYLYFPEYGEDYAAYIPFEDVTISAIVNENGRYMIGDKIVQEEIISTYEQLQETGRAYYVDRRPSSPLPNPPTPEPSKPRTVYAYKLGVPGGWWGSEIKVGLNRYEFVQDWKNVGDGKRIRVTFGRILKNRWANTTKVWWHTEVSFRKKGFLGAWYNYKSETSLSAEIKYDDKTSQKFSISAKGYSSHDGYFDCPYLEINPVSDYIILNQNTKEVEKTIYDKRLYRFKAYTVNLSVTYRGMPGTLYFQDTKPELWGYTDTRYKAFE